MKPFERNHDSVKEDISREEIKERDHDFEQNENDSDSFIDDVDLQEDFTNDPSNQIPVISSKEHWDELLEKRDNEDKIDRFNRENKSFESPQDGYLNYYDTVRIILTNYERVSANQAIPTNVVYLLF